MKMGMLVVGIFLAISSHAEPIQFSVTATANETKFGYTVGQEYSFSWVISDMYPENTGYFEPNGNYWTGGAVASFSGDGILGSDGSGVVPIVDSSLVTSNSLYSPPAYGDIIQTYMACPIGSEMNGVSLSYASIWMLEIGELSFSGVYTNPAEYFAGFVGTYAQTNWAMVSLRDGSSPSNGELQFDVAEVTIEAIPEPSSAVLIALVGGCGWFVRRFFPSV